MMAKQALVTSSKSLSRQSVSNPPAEVRQPPEWLAHVVAKLTSTRS